MPDIIACYMGIFIGIECKAGKNKPTPLQQVNLDQIEGAGGIALVINEDNINTVEELFNGRHTRRPSPVSQRDGSV